MDRCNYIIQGLFTLCYSQGKTIVDAGAFKRAVENRLTDDVTTTLELLEAFDAFDMDTKLEVVNECSKDIDTCEPIGSELILKASQSESFCEPMFIDANNIYTENELKKRIKYCKNPLEKKQLQKELDNLRFDNGKHKRGGKRRKKR